MEMKSLAAAVLALAASMGAQAGGTIGVGDLPIPYTTTVTGSLSGPGTIVDTWTFSTGDWSDANASASNTYVSLSGGVTILNKISSFAAKLDGHALTAIPDFTTPLGGGSSLVQQQLTIVPFRLGPGSHTLEIMGSVGDGGGSYLATLALAPAPVPEPETYALMLAGLGVIGFLARRRSPV